MRTSTTLTRTNELRRKSDAWEAERRADHYAPGGDFWDDTLRVRIIIPEEARCRPSAPVAA